MVDVTRCVGVHVMIFYRLLYSSTHTTAHISSTSVNNSKSKKKW